MFGNDHTDKLIARLEGEVEYLRAELIAERELHKANQQAWAEERRELMNRFMGLAPSPELIAQINEAKSQVNAPVSRVSEKFTALQQKQYEEFQREEERVKEASAKFAKAREEAKAKASALLTPEPETMDAE